MNKKKIKKVLVLGSAGQIGKPLTESLRQHGYEVFEFDIKNSLIQDIRIPNSYSLTRHILESDFVFFLAFDVGGSKYLNTKQGSYPFLQSNTEIMSNVFENLERTKTPFLFVSSQLANNQNSPYGIQKRLGEFYTYALGGVVTRLWNVYGIEEDNEKSHVITDLVRQMIKPPHEAKLLTDGTEKRQFLHADDCCEAFIALMENYNSIDRTIDYNVTSYVWSSIADVANLVAGQLNGSSWSPGDKKDTVHEQTPYEPNRNIASIWQPKIDLEAGIAKVIEHHRNKQQ